MSCLSRHFAAPACESLRSGPRMLEAAPRSPLDDVREDFIVKRSGNDFRRKVHFISLHLAMLAAHDVERGPVVRACSAFVGFAANAPRTTLFHRRRFRAACASAVVTIRPPFTFAYRIDANASLSQT